MHLDVINDIVQSDRQSCSRCCGFAIGLSRHQQPYAVVSHYIQGLYGPSEGLKRDSLELLTRQSLINRGCTIPLWSSAPRATAPSWNESAAASLKGGNNGSLAAIDLTHAQSLFIVSGAVVAHFSCRLAVKAQAKSCRRKFKFKSIVLVCTNMPIVPCHCKTSASISRKIRITESYAAT